MADDPMEQVVGRLKAEMQSAWPYAMAGVGAVPTHEFIADVTKLLAAYQSVREENAELSATIATLHANAFRTGGTE